MNMKCGVSITYGLLLIWTGLLRSIEAATFKPNAFWFCLTVGILSIVAGYFFQMQKRAIAIPLGVFAAATALSFYLYCFITKAEADASYRVGIAIVGSIASIALLLLPHAHPQPDSSPNN